MDYTICLPTRNRFKFANEALNCFLNNCNHNILLIDDCSNLCGEYIKNERIKVIYNKEKSGLSKMWNQFLYHTSSNNLIYTSDKSRPNIQDFYRFNTYINMGFGCVATWLMGIFAFPRSLIDVIGEFDEGFAYNGFEDTDFYNRLFVNNIALYISKETKYLDEPSSWGEASALNKDYYHTKWIEKTDKLVQLFKDKVTQSNLFLP